MQKTSAPKSKPTTIDEYLAGVPADKRVALERLRSSIHAALPGAEECISYGMPGFRLNGKVVAWFGAAANHCSFFPGGIVQDFKDELADYEISKGTIRFRPEQDISETLIRKLIEGQLSRRRTLAKKPTKSASAKVAKKINAKWHAAHPMPRPATLKERVAWHKAHAKHCGCREIPKSLRPYFETRSTKA